MPGEDPVYSNAVIDETNHEIVFVFDLTGIGDKDHGSKSFQVYPSPFREGTTIHINMPAAEKCTVLIYSTSGKLIRKLTGDVLQQGQQQIYWDGRDDSGKEIIPGAYMVVFGTGKGNQGTIILKN